VNPTAYVHRLRRVATWSWLAALAAVLVLARLRLLPSSPFLPFLALLIGAVPIAVFMLRARPSCAACGGRMRVSVGFPRIAFRCRGCGSEERTGIHADF